MAMSKSPQNKGQAIVTCQMCEEENQIKWKCLTCNSLMCNRCCKIHEKFKSSEEHKIVDIKEIGTHQNEPSSLDFSNIKCQNHLGQDCCIFCTDCQEVICPMCIAEAHNAHKLIPMKGGYELATKNLHFAYSSLEKELVRSASNIEVFGSMKSENISFCDQEKQRIIRHSQEMEDKLHIYTNKLLCQLETSTRQCSEKIDRDINFTKQIQADLDAKKENLHDAISSKSVFHVFRISKEIQNLKIPEGKQIDETKYRRIPKFFGKEVDMESIFGCLSSDTDEIEASPNIQFEVIISGESNLPEIQSVLCCSDGSLWISNFDSDKLQNVSLIKHSMLVNRRINISNVAKVKLTNLGELLISVQESSLLIVDPVSEKISVSKFSVAPFMTNSALHISKSNKIIVGARKFGPAFPVSRPRIVIVMNMLGEHETTYHFDSHNQPFFTCPAQITTDSYDQICIIDILSEDGEGRVFKLNSSGEISHVYFGQPGLKFVPWDFVYTKSDNLVVSDVENNTLHILNIEFQCIYSIDTRDTGIYWPMSLDIDNNGLLFVGCNSEEENNSNGMIHVVEYSGF